MEFCSEMKFTELCFQVDCKNQHSVKLLNTVLENKTLFQLTDDETKELVTRYWLDFKEACSDSHDDAVNKTLNSALKLICDHKSTDEWIELLTEVEKVICTLLLLSGKNIIKIVSVYIY